MIDTIRTLLAFLWTRDTKSWRAHRRSCIALLPKVEREAA